MYLFTIRAGRAIAMATLAGALLSTVPMHESRAQQASPQTQTMKQHAKPSADRTERRIKELHDKLRITPAQEALWGNVAASMRDNGKALRATVTDRSTRLKTMTAVDDLKSFQVIADQHSQGLRQLIPTFEALYASMSPAQQKNADKVFGEHQRRRSRA